MNQLAPKFTANRNSYLILIGLAFVVLVLGGCEHKPTDDLFGAQETTSIPYPPPKEGTPLETITMGMLYPPPKEGSPSRTITVQVPYPSTEEGIPSETPSRENPYLPPNLHSTFTPYPTPTQRPGATPTPFPFLQPAKDAAGAILYISRQVDKVAGSDVSLTTITVGAAGEAVGLPSRLPIVSISPWFTDAPVGFFAPSPDGSHMVIVDDAMEGSAFYLLDVNSGGVDELLGGKSLDAFFGWYPDSQHVLVSPGGGLLLWNIYNFDDYVPLAIPEYMSIDGAAASPDGQKVVYYSSNDFSSTAGVWMVNADGREAHLLFASSGVGNFAWSPDGRYITLEGGRKVMDADGSNLRELGNFSYCGKPRWSPDSRTLAIVIHTSADAVPCNRWSEDIFKGADILLVDVESGVSRPLLPDGNAGNLDPAWSPDGKQIVFVSNRSGAAEIWAVNADGTNLRSLTSDGQYKRFPYWRRP